MKGYKLHNYPVKSEKGKGAQLKKNHKGQNIKGTHKATGKNLKIKSEEISKEP
jgi:hypothetical protein